jgi:uncharacterized protein
MKTNLIRVWVVMSAIGTFLVFNQGCRAKEEQVFGLRTVDLKINGTVIHAEIADTQGALERGLMYRESMPEDRGMIFVLDHPQQAAFWMKNTRIPLSIAYIDQSGKILEIYDMQPLDEHTTESQSNQIVYALETNLGWFKSHHLTPGMQIDGLATVEK